MTSSNGPSAAVPVPGTGADTPPVLDRDALPERVWTIPNALSVLRLLGVPLFLYLLLGPEADGWAVAVLMVAGVTDWADGKLAKWLNQYSRLGALLDPAADRLYIVSTLVALALRDIVPVWVVALLVGREAVLGVALLVLRHYGYPPLQVAYLGKAATLLLLYAFPGLLLADGEGWLAIAIEPFAWAFTIWGTALYLLAGLLYLVQVAGIVRAERTARSGRDGPVTRTPRGGGLRSMGASLLDDVLAETLDPAYAQAAARRAGEPTPARRYRGRLLIALTMVAAGLLVAVTYDQAAATAQGRQQVRAALVEDIQRSSDAGDELTAELEDLRVEVSRTRDDLLDASAIGQRALDAVARAERGAAAVPVTGPGLLVTLANAGPDADDDPVGGTTEEDTRGRVRDGDLQLVVNALWAAGAEAVSINDLRLGAATAIRFAGEAVLVDFQPVMNPYEIRAIGDPDTLSARFLASPEVGALAVISETFDLRFEFAQEDELTLPAASTLELRYAAPVDAERDAPATDTTPGG